MHINVDTLIIGAGYSGLILQKKLQSMGFQNNIIVERGYENGYADSDYVVFTKNEYPFSADPLNVTTTMTSSGAHDFGTEYAKKIYNEKMNNIDIYYKDMEEAVGYSISNEYLLKGAKCYGNIAIESIDLENKKARGRVLHLKESVEIDYKFLVSTIPVHRFAKLVRTDLMKAFNMFISYYPIGIHKTSGNFDYPDMSIEYVSDPKIPYYRKQMYKSCIFYEYCLNKPMDIRFNHVIIPGRFKKLEEEVMGAFYEYFQLHGIYFAGRFATWDTDFLLEKIWSPDETLPSKFLQLFYEEL